MKEMKEDRNGKETQESGEDRNEPRREVCEKPYEKGT
jgi:hypothetical protein